MKRILVFILALGLLAALSACSSREISTEAATEAAKYYIVYSGINNNKAKIEGIDINGKLTVTHEINAMNISKSALVKDEFVAGGHRANNHLIMQKDGSFKEFFLLDNPHYSGVWSITLDNENIVSVMNGNIDNEKNVYLNLLVIQDRNQNILTKKEIDITPDAMLIDGDFLYMAGCFWDYSITPVYCGASIARYNMKTGEYEEKHFSYNENEITATGYAHLVKNGDFLYCTLRESLADKAEAGRQNKIDLIDIETFEIIDTLLFDYAINEVCLVNDDLYLVAANKLCKYDVTEQMITPLYAFPENTTVNGLIAGKNHIYCNARYYPSQKKGRMLNIGYLIDFDVNSESATLTSLSTDAKNVDSIVFFPIEN